MNRELKFRVWDNLKKEWLKNKVYHFNLFCNESGVGEFRLNQHPEGFTIQQYTGLKDSKGVEIYEGDILTCKYADQEVTEAIEYSEEYAAFTHGEKALWRGWLGEAEIIGNIFENPELLKH